MITPKAIDLQGPLTRGKTITVLSESPTAAGAEARQFSLDADNILVSLFATAVTGTLDVKVETLTTDDPTDKAIEVITFPSVTAATSNLLIKKTAAVMSRIRITATYTGSATYEVRARGIGTGETSVKILGPAEGSASQIDVPASATLILPAATNDRNGIVIKNFETAGTKILYLGYTAVEATTAVGFPLEGKESLGIDLAAGTEIYAIADSGTIDVRLLEAAN
jgi:hypothetical protein